MEDLNKLRSQINEIDDELIMLFKRRMEVVKKIAKYKIENSMDVLDRSREKQIIARHTDNIEDDNLKLELSEFIGSLLQISRKAQQRLIDEKIDE